MATPANHTSVCSELSRRDVTTVNGVRLALLVGTFYVEFSVGTAILLNFDHFFYSDSSFGDQLVFNFFRFCFKLDFNVKKIS